MLLAVHLDRFFNERRAAVDISGYRVRFLDA
jgi:hypothetical protein